MNAIKHGVRAGLLVIFTAIFAVSAIGRAQAAPFAAYVMDGRTGQTLYQQNADTPLHPASLTKMMTLYLAFAAIEQGKVRLDSKFTVSSHAASQAPSKLGLRAGQQIELRYLIRAAAVKSANDAATTIGENLGGSEAKFAAQMTATARALGMKSTTFRNANGLSAEGHYSTARDMTVLGRHLFYDFPQYYSIFSRRSADAGIATVHSTNARFLDTYEGADGIKTGYTRAAGFNLTASAQRGNKRIMATVLGGTSTAQRNQVMAQLLDAGFAGSPARVAEVRPSSVVVAPDRVRRAKVAPAAIAAAAPARATASTAPVGVASAATIGVAAPVARSKTLALAAPVSVAPTGARVAVAPAGARAAAAPSDEAPDKAQLSAALREAMAERPARAPGRPAVRGTATASTAGIATPTARKIKKVIPPVVADTDAVVAATSRPAARPEGSGPDTDTEIRPTPARR